VLLDSMDHQLVRLALQMDQSEKFAILSLEDTLHVKLDFSD